MNTKEREVLSKLPILGIQNRENNENEELLNMYSPFKCNECGGT